MTPGHRLPTGETLMGHTDDGTPIWSEPVAPRPTSDGIHEDGMYEVPGSRLRELRDAVTERDVLVARVTDLEAQVAALTQERDAALAVNHVTVTVEKARAEAAEARCARLQQEAVPYELVLLLEAAELEVQRLREERDTLTERDYWTSQTIREQEAELVRLREMLARVRPDIDPETGYGRVEAI